MSKTFLFQVIQFSQTVLIRTIQFSISIVFVYSQLNIKLFYFKQFILALVGSLNIKTVPVQVIQFSISTQISSIWPIDRTLSGATSPKWIWKHWQWRGDPHFPKLQHYWNLTVRLFSVISRTLIGGVLPLTKKQLVYSIARANWVTYWYWVFYLEQHHSNVTWNDLKKLSA